MSGFTKPTQLPPSVKQEIKEEEMQGVSESDLEEEERRGQRDQPY